MSDELWGAFLVVHPRPPDGPRPVVKVVGVLVAKLRLEDEDTWREGVK